MTPICFGGAPLASMPENFGYEVDEARAVAPVRAVLDGPINLLDTSNDYGGGRSEERIVRLVRWYGAPHASLVEWERTGAYPAFEDPPAEA